MIEFSRTNSKEHSAHFNRKEALHLSLPMAVFHLIFPLCVFLVCLSRIRSWLIYEYSYKLFTHSKQRGEPFRAGLQCRGAGGIPVKEQTFLRTLPDGLIHSDVAKLNVNNLSGMKLLEGNYDCYLQRQRLVHYLT